MIEATTVVRIRNNPLFKELVRRRRKFVALLTTATRLPYYSFLLIAGFTPELFATKYAGTSVINIGWILGLVMIVGTWLLTGLYVRRANGVFDDLTSRILAEVKK